MMASSALLRICIALLVITVDALSLPAKRLPAAAALYSSALDSNPLGVKMATAAFLAVMSDALVQCKGTPGEYDGRRYDMRRAASFATFNALYKGVVLHFSVPAIYAACQGNVLRQAIRPLWQGGFGDTLCKALERTMANQLILMPLVYCPVFFAVTGFVQGLSLRASWQRMRENYFSMCFTTLRFWVPVQIIQFIFVPLKWQVSSIQVTSFIWNVILSSLVGSCKGDAECEITRT